MGFKFKMVDWVMIAYLGHWWLVKHVMIRRTQLNDSNDEYLWLSVLEYESNDLINIYVHFYILFLLITNNGLYVIQQFFCFKSIISPESQHQKSGHSNQNQWYKD